MTYKELYEKCKEEFQLENTTINYFFKYFLHLTEKDKLDNTKISTYKVKSLIKKIDEYNQGVPIQYVVGNTNFYGYDFIVKKGALIPRFETEQLVYYAKEFISKYFKNKVKIIDLGTGTGAIGLTLKKELPDVDVTLVDISSKALRIAKQNADMLAVNVNIYKSDMLSKVIEKAERYDVLISNPPYVRNDEEVMGIVKNNEPSLALYGGKSGLKFYRKIFKEAKKVINGKALIALEMGATQGQELVHLAHIYFPNSPYEIKKDWEGRDRMFFLFYNLID